MPTPLLLNGDRAADFLGIPVGVLRRLIRSGDIPTVSIEKRVMVPTEALVEWVRSHTKKPAAASLPIPEL